MRLSTTWRSRPASPSTIGASLSAATSNTTGRPAKPRTASEHTPSRSTALVQRAFGVEDGPAAAVRRRAGPSVATGSRCPRTPAAPLRRDGTLPVQLRRAAHPGQRGTQLMAGVGDELPHADLRGPGLLEGLFALVEGDLQPVQHRVECQTDITGLRARRGWGTRWVRSPPLIARAVSSTACNGRSERRTATVLSVGHQGQRTPTRVPAIPAARRHQHRPRTATITVPVGVGRPAPASHRGERHRWWRTSGGSSQEGRGAEPPAGCSADRRPSPCCRPLG